MTSIQFRDIFKMPIPDIVDCLCSPRKNDVKSILGPLLVKMDEPESMTLSWHDRKMIEDITDRRA